MQKYLYSWNNIKKVTQRNELILIWLYLFIWNNYIIRLNQTIEIAHFRNTWKIDLR